MYSIILLLYDLEKLNHANNNILFNQSSILFEKNKNKSKVNYERGINIIENSYNKLNHNLNPSLGFYAMTIQLKKILNPIHEK